MASSRTSEENSAHPWTEDPVAAYQTYIDQGKTKSVAFSGTALTLFGSAASAAAGGGEKNPEVYVENGTFNPLRTVLSHPVYCSKITIRNIENAYLTFNFADNIMHRILGMESLGGEEGERLNVAYRNITPKCYSGAPSLAGPLGFHEYLIDGSSFKDLAVLQFSANTSFDGKVVFENCKGYVNVKGLSQEAVDKIFQNKCDGENLVITPIPSVQPRM